MPKIVINSSSQPQYPSWKPPTDLEKFEIIDEIDISTDNSDQLQQQLNTAVSNYEVLIANSQTPPTGSEWTENTTTEAASPSPVTPTWAYIQRHNRSWVKSYKSEKKITERVRNYLNAVWTSDPRKFSVGGGVTIKNGRSGIVMRYYRSAPDKEWLMQGLGRQRKFELSETFIIEETHVFSTPMWLPLDRDTVVKQLTGRNPSHNTEVANKSLVALTAVTAQANSALYDLATSIAEGAGTISTLSSIVSGATSGINRYKHAINRLPKKYLGKGGTKRFATDAKNLSKEVLQHHADAWLGYRYGIMPIVYEAQSIQQALGPSYTVEKGYSKESVKTENTRSGTQYVSKIRTKTDLRAFYRGSFQEFSGKKVQMHLPTTFVELVPYSVVANWFVNIKDYVASKRTIPHALIAYGLSQKESEEITVDALPRSYKTTIQSQNGTVMIFGGQVFIRGYEVQTRSSAGPTSQLKVDVDMSAFRSVDALALLLSRFL